MLDLEAAKKICEAATPGPWHIGHIDENLDHAFIEDFDGAEVAEIYHRYDEGFFCFARTALPEAIAEIEGRWKDDLILRETIAERDAEIERLRQSVGFGDTAVGELRSQLAARDQEIAELKRFARKFTRCI